jgi:hypothetical protein
MSGSKGSCRVSVEIMDIESNVLMDTFFAYVNIPYSVKLNTSRCPKSVKLRRFVQNLPK